jgi:hypothetical protein
MKPAPSRGQDSYKKHSSDMSVRYISELTRKRNFDDPTTTPAC